MKQKLEDNRQNYNPAEEDVICPRFPHLNVSAQEHPGEAAIQDITLFEVYDGIFMGPF